MTFIYHINRKIKTTYFSQIGSLNSKIDNANSNSNNSVSRQPKSFNFSSCESLFLHYSNVTTARKPFPGKCLDLAWLVTYSVGVLKLSPENHHKMSFCSVIIIPVTTTDQTVCICKVIFWASTPLDCKLG